MTIEDAWDIWSDNTALSEGDYERMMDKDSFKEVTLMLIKLHVEQALKNAHNNSQLPIEDLEFTLDCYPTENIK